MLAPLLLASLFTSPPVAINDVTPGAFTCNDPLFQLVRDGGKADLKGEIIVPQLGFTYHFMQFAPANGEVRATLTAGQPLSGGRGVPQIDKLQVAERVNMPEGVRVLRLSIQNLTVQPREVICAEAPPPPA